MPNKNEARGSSPRKATKPEFLKVNLINCVQKGFEDSDEKLVPT